MEPINRREGLRIEHDMVLVVSPIDNDQIDQLDEYFTQRRSAFSVQTHLRYRVDSHLPEMRILEKKSPNVAAYLKFLESQIDFLATKILQGCKSEISIDEQLVSISSVGLRFETEQDLKDGDVIELEMRLDNSRLYIFTIAKIIRVEVNVDNPHTRFVSAKYSMIHVEDQEALIKAIHRKHIEQLRE